MQISLRNTNILLLVPDGYDREERGSKLYKELGTKLGITNHEVLSKFTSNSDGLVIIHPISKDYSMEFGNKQLIIDKLHDSMGDSQGLIEVDCGKTVRGYDYIYSIVKTYNRDTLEVDFRLRLDITDGNEIQEVEGYFFESGMTGGRDATGGIFADIAGLSTLTADGREGWAEDPYDPTYKKGVPMILSERRGMDGLFPEHPLSQARELLLALVNDSYYKTREELRAADGEGKIEETEEKTELSDEEKKENEERNKEFYNKVLGKETKRAGAYSVQIEEVPKEIETYPAEFINHIPYVDDSVKETETFIQNIRTIAGNLRYRDYYADVPFNVPREFCFKLNREITELPGWGKRKYVGFAGQTDQGSALLFSWPVTAKESMPFGAKQALIDDFHQTMGDDIGLIKVETGDTAAGNKYVYSIRKMNMRDEESESGVTNYQLNFNICIDDVIHFIDGSFVPEGEESGREQFVSEQTGIKQDSSDWFNDPYDPEYKKGFLMNLSECEDYDDKFPEHPLSMLRYFVKYVIENN